MREHRPLLLLIAAQATFALLVWLSGSMYGSWAIECGVGSIAHDLARGLNPDVPLSDYYDGWTSGYLLAGIVGAPLQWLPVRSIYALKATCLLFDAAIATLAWLFLRRNVGPRAALAGTALLVVCPPQLAFYAVHAGDYHYTELLFDLGMAALLAEVAIHGRRGWGWYAALGGVCGLAITNCLGSAPYVAVVLLLLWILDKGSLLRPQFWAAPIAGLLGLAPLLYKLFLHDPYGMGRGPVGAKLFYVRGAAPGGPTTWDKLVDLPISYTANLGFTDGLRPLMPWQGSWGLAAVYALLTALPIALVLALRWRQVGGLLRGLLPGGRFAPDAEARRAAGELILAGFALAFLLAYLRSDQLLVGEHPHRSQFRSNRFLPPVIALFAINAGVFVQLLSDRLSEARRRWTGLLWIPLAGLCALSWVGMVDWGGFASSGGIPYRGHCRDLQGLYASSFLPDVDGVGGGPDRWADVDICAGFDVGERSDCFLGRTWGVGRRHVREKEMAVTAPDSWSPSPALLRACEALPGGWRDDCYRQVGWTINWGILKAGHGPPWALLPGYCDAMPDADASDRCIEGGGFYLGDHYAFAPWKFDHLVPPDRATPRVRQRLVAGIGVALTHYLERTARAVDICADYGALDPTLEQPCLEGVDAGVAARARPFPPWEGWPRAGVVTLEPAEVTVGRRVDLAIELEAGAGGLDAGSTLWIGFPHAYHAARSQQPGDPYPPVLGRIEASDRHGALTARERPKSMGHHYAEVDLARRLEEGEVLRVVLPGWTTPHYATARFEPRLLLRRAGQERPRRLPSTAALRVRPGEPTTLVAVAGPLARPGHPVEIGVRLQDGWGNPVDEQPTAAVIAGRSHPLERGRALLEPLAPGLHRLEVEAAGLSAVAPILVEEHDRRLVWADLHGHSALSDGAGSADDYYAYARDVGLLDAAALCDHDWQLTDDEVSWAADAALAATDGRFVAIPAAETNVHGHEVAWFADVERYRALGAGTTDGPKELWEEVDFGPAGARKPPALERLRSVGAAGVVTASHTTLAPTMGSAVPLPEELPGYAQVEIYSAHGSSACRACERSLFAPGAGDPDRPPGVPEGVATVAEVLDAHGPLGLMAAGDSHDGRPGNSGWAAWPGGLTGLYVDELTRGGVLDAMRQRRTIATTGRRTLIQLEVGGTSAGALIPPTTAPRTLRLRALDVAPIAELRLVRDGVRLETLERPSEATWHTVTDPDPSEARWYYAEVLLADGELAWSSPIFVAATGSEGGP
jgi:hypothetical protein